MNSIGDNMKKIFVVVAMMFSVNVDAQNTVQADSGIFKGVEATTGYFRGLKVVRDSTSTQSGVVPSFHAMTTIYPGSNEYAWNILGQLVNMSDTAGESVAIYGQAVKDGKAPTWALVGEAQCNHPRGACYALELDIMGNGEITAGDARTGILLVAGKATAISSSQIPASITAAIDVQSFGYNNANVNLQHGLRFGIPCVYNCVQIPSDSKVSLDGGNGDAELKFDSQTGFVGFWSTRRQTWIKAWNATDGREWK